MATPSRHNPITIRGPGAKDLVQALRKLSEQEVLAGFPAETTERAPDEGEEPSDITNAALGYIHENGDPENNIPARPFMGPAIRENSEGIEDRLGAIGRAFVRGNGDPATVEQGMHRLGLFVKLAIQKKINDGVPPPLSEATLRRRAARGRKGAQKELDRRAEGLPPGMGLAKPLVDTAKMRNAVNYVIRSKKDRS